MKRCDICLRGVDNLYTVNEKFQCEGVKELCYDCDKEVTAVISTAMTKLDKLEAKTKKSIFSLFVRSKKEADAD